MRKILFASAALSTLALGLAATGVQAAPLLGGKTVAQAAPSQIENVFWRRVCDRDGDRCHRVWIRGRWWR